MSPLLKSAHYRSTGFIIVYPDPLSFHRICNPVVCLYSGRLQICRYGNQSPVREPISGTGTSLPVRELISGTKLPAEVSSGLLTQPSLNRVLPAPSSFFVRSIQILLQRRRILAVILRREETVEFNPGILRRIRSMHDVFL